MMRCLICKTIMKKKEFKDYIYYECTNCTYKVYKPKEVKNG